MFLSRMRSDSLNIKFPSLENSRFLENLISQPTQKCFPAGKMRGEYFLLSSKETPFSDEFMPSSQAPPRGTNQTVLTFILYFL